MGGFGCGPDDTGDIEQELRLAKAAAVEWRDKYEQAEKRTAATWDLALHEARMRLGHHVPACFEPCIKCWFYDEISKMMRLDRGNYVPVKERLRTRAEMLKDTNSLPGALREAHARGVDDIMMFVEKWLADTE